MVGTDPPPGMRTVTRRRGRGQLTKQGVRSRRSELRVRFSRSGRIQGADEGRRRYSEQIHGVKVSLGLWSSDT